MTEKIDKDSLWNQYNVHVDLYKHYLKLILKFNIFYYAVTGAILSFYLSKSDTHIIRFSLLFPVLMSVGFGLFFFYAANQLHVVREEVFKIRDALKLDTAPEMMVLIYLLRLCAILFIAVSICLCAIFLFPLT